MSLFDIKKCYRSIYTSDETNNLRIIPLWEDKNDNECKAILKYQRMCFGDVCASTVLLLAYAHYVLPTLTSPLARNVLSALYVDDSLTGNRNKHDLEEAVNEVCAAISVAMPNQVLFCHLEIELFNRSSAALVTSGII